MQAALFASLAVVLFVIGLDIARDGHYLGEITVNKQSWRTLTEIFRPLISSLMPGLIIKQVEQRLTWAGNPFNLDAETFLAIRFLFLLAGTLLGFIITLLGMPSIVNLISALIAFLIPEALLKETYKKRQRKINRDLPNMINLLQTAIYAGVELGPALEAVGRNFPGPLGDELRIAWREIATGRSRAGALRAMGKRTGVIALERFIEAIVTAEERGGVNLSEAINNFRVELVNSQLRKVQEEANKIPTRMLAPIFICIFIPMLVLLLFPVVVQVLEGL
jgi:tight adherence protein C